MYDALFRGMNGDAVASGSRLAAHLPALCLLAQRFGQNVVELGVGRGWSTAALLEGVNQAKGMLTSYDIQGACGDQALRSMGVGPGDPELGRWRFVVGDSIKAAAAWQEETVSLVFLDTLHTHDRTAAELDAWLPKIHPRGAMCGHDYFVRKRWQTLNVRDAVDAFAAKHASRFRLQVLPHDDGLFVLWPVERRPPC